MLLYTWIEEYKNIKKQGFNFSPNYTFHFDEEKKSMTIEQNENYLPENFYGENIQNITAIVGKNGSGKSNLLETIINDFISKNENGLTFHSKLFVLLNDNFLTIAVHEKYKGFELNFEFEHNFSGLHYYLIAHREVLGFFDKIDNEIQFMPLDERTLNIQNSIIYFSNLFDIRSLYIDKDKYYNSTLYDNRAIYANEKLINISTDSFLIVSVRC